MLNTLIILVLRQRRTINLCYALPLMLFARYPRTKLQVIERRQGLLQHVKLESVFREIGEDPYVKHTRIQLGMKRAKS